MGNLGSLIQILIFVAVIAGPTIGAIAKKAKSHAEEKRIAAERQKRRIEAIRTGQVSDDLGTIDPNARTTIQVQSQPTARPQTAAQARSAAADAARQQRQQQIAELRRRYQAQQAAQQQAKAQRPQTAGQAAGPIPGRPSVQTTGPMSTAGRAAANQREAELVRRREEIRRRREAIAAQRGQSAASRKRQRSDAQNPSQSSVPKQTRKAKKQAAAAAVAAESLMKGVPASRVDQSRSRDGSSSRAHPLAAALRSPSELRRAIVLSEILSPPVSLRSEQSGE